MNSKTGWQVSNNTQADNANVSNAIDATSISAAQNNPYLYILIRKDLSLPQMIVQSCHAAIEIAKKYSTNVHPYVIVCDVKNELDLLTQCAYLSGKGIDFVEFREPDRNNELTSICSEPLYGAERKVFSKFQTFKGE